MTAAILAVALSAATSSAQPADDAAPRLYEQVRRSVLQVRVIDKASSNKSSTGSGFPIGGDGLVATNFHVISSVVHRPRKFRIQLIDYTEALLEARIVAVDIVHDLAILTVEDPEALPAPLPFAGEAPEKGATVYSLGYPYDVGITMTPGTYNGPIAHTAYGRLHFSGALNPGMSGGPAVDRAGRVIGVNVATAGNQLSFLVPAAALKVLAERPREDGKDALKASIGRQLRENGERLIDEIVDGDWSAEPIGDGEAPGEFTDYVRCWGTSNAEADDATYLQVARHCRIDDEIFVRRSLSTGRIGVEYFWLESDELSRFRFYTRYRELFGSFVSDNMAWDKEVGPYQCRTRFVRDDASAAEVAKAVYCVRGYKDYDDLYDILYARATTDLETSAFMVHYTLAGVTREGARRFDEKFTESETWLSSK